MSSLDVGFLSKYIESGHVHRCFFLTVVSYLQESVPDPSTATRILASMRRVRIGRAMRPDRPVRPASGLVGSLRLGTSWADQASQGLISLGSLITGLKWS